MANDGGYRFNDCYNFVKKENLSRFREIGSLTAGVVQPPTVAEVGNIIRGINKGGALGLEMLGPLKPRERGAERRWRLVNVEEVKAGFGKLYTFLDKKLTAAPKGHMIFDRIMTENSLCKLTRVVKENQFFISMLVQIYCDCTAQACSAVQNLKWKASACRDHWEIGLHCTAQVCIALHFSLK
ncbi:hypothetical protein C8R43DRAFT_960374 [Mycena crocata]|nr:hypothetical protein C8R43DRAFT_960374 [Mycena crocata]